VTGVLHKGGGVKRRKEGESRGAWVAPVRSRVRDLSAGGGRVTSTGQDHLPVTSKQRRGDVSEKTLEFAGSSPGKRLIQTGREKGKMFRQYKGGEKGGETRTN